MPLDTTILESSTLPKTEDDPDILHVTRTWAFLPEGELVDR